MSWANLLKKTSPNTIEEYKLRNRLMTALMLQVHRDRLDRPFKAKPREKEIPLSSLIDYAASFMLPLAQRKTNCFFYSPSTRQQPKQCSQTSVSQPSCNSRPITEHSCCLSPFPRAAPSATSPSRAIPQTAKFLITFIRQYKIE